MNQNYPKKSKNKNKNLRHTIFRRQIDYGIQSIQK